MTDTATLKELQERMAAASPMPLEDLFRTAEGFGHVRVYSSDDVPPGSGYNVRIIFPCISGCDLQASSDFKLGLQEALHQAIERAEKIRGQFK